MQEVFSDLIKEWHDADLPPFIARDNYDYLHQNYANIFAVIWPRRAGKTFFLYQIIQHLLDSNTCKKEDILFIDFEDYRLSGLKIADIDSMFKAYYALYKKDPKYLIFDEIQNIPERSRVLRTFHNKRYKIIVTGSSSKLLLTEVSTELRWRYTHNLMLPFSFWEYLKHKDIDPKRLERTNKEWLVYDAFQQYMQYGWYPEVIDANDLQKRKLLNEYYATTYYKDVIDRYNVRDKKLLEGFMSYVLNIYSSLLSLTKLEKHLKDEWLTGTKSTLGRYLSHLKEAFFIIECPKFGYSPKVEMTQPKKVYMIDPGFIKIGNNYSENKWRILENIVAIELFRRWKQLYYFNDGRECDFVIKEPLSLKIEQAIQVTRTLDFHNKEREIQWLLQAMKKCKLSQGYIFTYDEKKIIVEDGCTIYVVPVWERLLENEDVVV